MVEMDTLDTEGGGEKEPVRHPERCFDRITQTWLTMAIPHCQLKNGDSFVSVSLTSHMNSSHP